MIMVAIDTADVRAVITTLVGSMMPALDEVAVLLGDDVEAVVTAQLGDLVDHHRALQPGVGRDLLERRGERVADDARPGEGVSLQA
jgi:hypothetical protein